MTALSSCARHGSRLRWSGTKRRRQSPQAFRDVSPLVTSSMLRLLLLLLLLLLCLLHFLLLLQLVVVLLLLFV